ncbi:caffeic acid 3-O-methyltransferase-like protein [Tanacetum coccineum]
MVIQYSPFGDRESLKLAFVKLHDMMMFGSCSYSKAMIARSWGDLSKEANLLEKAVWLGFELKDSVVEGGIPFNKVHGTHAFEYPALDARFNEVFNNAMVNHTTIAMKTILECYHGFDNLKSVVDVGGGLGITINMIVSKHPTIQGINFDLPHVTRHAPLYPEHVGGDMFQEVPQGDAIFMKWILHDWNDHFTKLLKNCYKALSKNGNVIVVEAVLPFLDETSSFVKVSTQIGAIMMTQNPGGKERTEDEFLALGKSDGFKGIKKKCFACNFWVMEFYKQR